MMTHQTMTIRAATPLDGAALARLARLDCRRERGGLLGDRGVHPFRLVVE
jgi:hypothetical protein